MGYLLPTENVMQILVLRADALLAFGGGLFVPLSQLRARVLQTIASFTPLVRASTRWSTRR